MTNTPSQILIQRIAQSISKSLIVNQKKNDYIASLIGLDTSVLEQVCNLSEGRITNLDIKYIICFMIDMDVKDISLLFNIEPASVHTVRYRIKKKFGDNQQLKLLI
ncbi:hypothetical protein LJC30_04600 [Odoribacter sp. OttesenSCG-928-L07]|nr:hypothetical protein [Odoribacter sp. OttesenSCG-928-L07]MDL2239084.1 hypothetical protein [Bacteroidales bacterium OttesenSCG-928-L14]MDL2239997.1 hypothetical protein [Bacteroidales bacterium OttesenSCG-928-K22]